MALTKHDLKEVKNESAYNVRNSSHMIVNLLLVH